MRQRKHELTNHVQNYIEPLQRSQADIPQYYLRAFDNRCTHCHHFPASMAYRQLRTRENLDSSSTPPAIPATAISKFRTSRQTILNWSNSIWPKEDRKKAKPPRKNRLSEACSICFSLNPNWILSDTRSASSQTRQKDSVNAGAPHYRPRCWPHGLVAGCPGLALLLCVPGFALPVVDETSVPSRR